jgi:hypothetical protein
MLDALQLAMIPLTGTTQPLTFRFMIDTPFGFTTQDLTLDIPTLPFTLEVMSRFAPSLWSTCFGSASSASVHCSIATVVNWKGTGGFILSVPFVTQSGRVHTTAASQDESGVLILHTGHTDNFARRRIYLAGMPRNWQFQGLLNGTGQSEIYNAVSRMYMAFKGTALANPYRWLIAYPRVVEAGETNLFGVAFRQPEYFRIANHCGKPQEGISLDWP